MPAVGERLKRLIGAPAYGACGAPELEAGDDEMACKLKPVVIYATREPMNR